MGVLSHAYVLDAVIDLNSDDVATSHFHVFGHVIDMRGGKRHLVSYFLPIDKDSGFDVGTFQKQFDALSFPVLWYVELAFVPCVAHVVLFGGEEERELHFAFLAILLHVGVKVVTGVVERACPRGVDIHVVAFVVG